ncbi:unnamed protein product [Lasius platythorax]|uniref:Endonuclease-reverse transcriptase n=2 Tax=Lasius TaxID=488720 RepID=A0A0J7N260_LASNI|nr:endonuclease-reverse transcriptase [Lasius niger]
MVKKQCWMTYEIMELMSERRSYKGRDLAKYKEVHHVIRWKIHLAKEQRLAEQCERIKDLQHRHDSFNVHKTIKETLGINKSRGYGILFDSTHNIAVSITEKLKVWQIYIEKFFQ